MTGVASGLAEHHLHLAMEDFGHRVLIILSVVFSVRGDTVHLTMVTSTPYGAGSSSVSISCFRSSPDENVTLRFGRPFQIGLLGSTVQTSTTLPAGSTVSADGQYQQAVTKNLTSSNDATGLFYCEGSNRNLTTRVYSIIHSIHRRFEPHNGLVTKTINKGEDATLMIDSVNSNTHPLWHRNNNGTAVRLHAYDEMYNITIPSGNVSDGDLYAVIQTAVSLNDNHFSLIRLIVRGCTTGRWGPPGCEDVCDMCYNGGVCDDETGDCICPPGFSGPNCLTACGMHRFGWSCELQCGPGNIIQSCTESQFGLPDPYGNSCISGYHGRDCNVVCSSGMFGAGCTQTCHCQSGMCDAYTGVCTTPCSSGICSSSACTQGWLGSNCQIPDECPAGYYGEQCLSKCNCLNDAACDKISGYCSGGCAPGFTCVTNLCTHSPCLNGGSCIIQGSTFSCSCPSPYVGIRCESGLVLCTPNPCMNGGTCRAQGFMFSCTCLSGYSGSTCEIFDPCYSNPCLNGGACRAQGFMFSCICQSGYSGSTCEILSPCSSSPCQHGGTCSAQGSTFSCNCQYPFSGNTCEIFNQCSTSPCQHGGTCSAQGSTFSCTCPPDYTGNNCEAFIFQIACSSGVTVFGTPGMTTSVEIPQPFVSSNLNNIHFTYMGPQGIIATPTSYQVPVPLTGSTTVDIHVTARGPFNIIQQSCQISVTVTGFQMMCTPNISVVGSPGSNVSVAVPEPTVSGGVEGVTFAYMVESASIPTPSSYDVIVPDTGSTTVMVNVIPVVSFSYGMSCNISVIIKGLPFLNQTPSVSFESGSARVTWQAWNTSSGDRGVGPVIAYKVYYSLGSPVSWSVTGNISVTDPSQSTYSFTVQPLEPSTEYMFSVAAVGEGTGEGSRSPAFTGLSLPLPITTTERDTSKETTVTKGISHPTGRSSTTPAGPSNPTTVIAATVSVVAVLLVVLLILAVLLVLRIRRRRSKDVSSRSLRGKFESSNDLSSLQTIDNPISVPMEDINSNPNGEGVPEMTPAVRPESSVSQISTLDSSSPFAGLPLYPTKERELKKDPIPLKDFVAYVQQAIQGHHLGDEWSSFPGIEAICSCDVSQLSDNKMKNRYRNIPAYDHCRVILEHDKDDPNLGYINACYIKGYKKDKAYIATQGPNQATSHDFWKMVWQENVRIIVNGTKLVEDGKNKCSKYWPDMGKSEIFGGILISLHTEEARGEYTVRTMSIAKIGDNTSGARTVRQYHYTTWPDKNVPKDVTPVLRLIKEFSDATSEGAGPYLIHCSAGVGRTGAIIAIHALLQQAHAEKTLDIYNFVADMRDHRVSIVQTPVQYTFIHLALLEALFSGDTCIPSSSLKKRVTELKKKKKMAEEFEQMNTITPVPVRERCRMSVVASNRNKNRFPNTIIPETCRPFLMTPREDGMEYNYINATFVDGYKRKDVAVVTQAPLPNTVLDLWRLLYDYQVTNIVMLNAMDASDSDCPQYWPDKGSQDYGPFTVSVTSAAELDGYKVKQLILHHRRQTRSRYLKHYQVTDWPVNQETPKSPSTLLRLILTVEKEKKGKHSSILVHCIDGQNRSGVFCVLKNSLDRLRQDDTVDIMQTTKVLRLNRPNMLNSLNLYRFCYDAMLAYVSNPDEFKADGLPEPVYENMPTKQKEEKAKPQENIYQNVAKPSESSEA